MRLLDVGKKEDCFDGSMIYRYYFDSEVGEGLMRSLAEGGKLQYFPEFSRPFFKIVDIHGLQIKGILGDPYFEVVFPLTGGDQKKQNFETTLHRLIL